MYTPLLYYTQCDQILLNRSESLWRASRKIITTKRDSLRGASRVTKYSHGNPLENNYIRYICDRTKKKKPPTRFT